MVKEINQFLFEFDSHDGASVTRQRFATGKGFQTKKSETPSLAKYKALLVDSGLVESFLFKNATTRGTSFTGAGKVRLNNADRGLDFLFDEGADGREAIIRENKGPNFPADFPSRFTGSVDRKTFTDLFLDIDLADKLGAIFALPFQTFKYAGNNSGGTDVEGTADDIGGLPKPRLRGNALNFQPILVNESTRIYQISSDEIESVDVVYDGRAALTLDTLHTDFATFLGDTATAGQFNVYEGDNTEALGTNDRGAYIMLGSDPAFQLTCDATEGATTGDRTFAQIAKRIIEDRGFTVDAAAVTALDTLVAFEVQHWQGTQETNPGEVIDALAVSIGAFWTDDITLANDFTLGQLALPTFVEKKKTFTNQQLMNLSKNEKIRIVRSNDPEKGIPINRINLGYSQNYTIMAIDDLTGVGKTLAEAAKINEPFRKVNSSDATVKIKNLNSPEMNLNTKLVNKTNAQSIADFWLQLYSLQRQFIEFRVPIELGESINLDDVVSVDSKLYRIMGKRIRFPRAGASGETAVAITFQGWGGIPDQPNDVFSVDFSDDFD